MLPFGRGCFGRVSGLATAATWKNCILQLETVFRVNFANSISSEAPAGPMGLGRPVSAPTEWISSPTQQWVRGCQHQHQQSPVGGRRKRRAAQLTPHALAGLHLPLGQLHKLPPSQERSFCAPSFVPLPPGPCGHLGSTILGRELTFPLSFKLHCRHLGKGISGSWGLSFFPVGFVKFSNFVSSGYLLGLFLPFAVPLVSKQLFFH